MPSDFQTGAGVLRWVTRVGGVHPLLDGLLHLVVEGGRDLVAAGVDRLAGLGVLLAAQERAELVADLPHEVRRLPGRQLQRREDQRLLLRGLVLGGGVLRAGQHAAGRVLHQVQDVVAPDDDLGIRGHDERDLGGRAVGALLDRNLALADRIARQVELGR